jgi:hypothetical protein
MGLSTDVDKLDYLIRDSNHCQTVFGRGIDRPRLLSTLTVVYERQGKQQDQYFALGIHEKGRAAAESLAFIRFQMFQAVYWHHAVRAAKAMLQRAAFEWLAPDRRDPRGHDARKTELYEFVLQKARGDSLAAAGQREIFEPTIDSLAGEVGDAVRPQWSLLNHADLLALEWLHRRTTDTGKQLIQALTTRRLYKRIFVISFSQDASLWTKIQNDVSNHERLREKSEELRRALKSRVDAGLEAASEAGVHFVITGVGEDDDSVTRAADALKLPGTVLMDVPKARGREVLRFYPEDLHRGQRDEFEDLPLLNVSEGWKQFSEKLHEAAGSIRVFVHPEIDVLRSARPGLAGTPLLSSSALEEELRSLFGA